jgi:hypothetical protein
MVAVGSVVLAGRGSVDGDVLMWTPRVFAVDVCPQRSRSRPKQVRLFSSRVYDIWSYSSKSIYLTSHVAKSSPLLP